MGKKLWWMRHFTPEFIAIKNTFRGTLVSAGRYAYQIQPRKPWHEVTLDWYHRAVLDRIAKRVSAIHTKRSAEWLRLVADIYEGDPLPPAVADSITRLQLYCEGKLAPPKRFPEAPPEPYDLETEDW